MLKHEEEIEKQRIREAYREAVTDTTTDSGIPVKEVYTPEDMSGIDYEEDIGLPGQYPFTRGYHPRMYRGRLWAIRLVSGTGTPGSHNKRCKYLVSQGANALDWQIDGTSNYGIEPDQPFAEGHLGKYGVPVHTLRDVEILSDGLPLDEISIAIEAFFPAIMQAYILVAKKRGYDIRNLRVVGGAPQYHVAPFYQSCPEVLYVNGRFSTLARWGNDFIEYVLKNFPRWNVWFADSDGWVGAGANAVLEGALLIACTKELIREMLRRGVDINTIGKRISPNLSAGRDFFQDIAKLRALRRTWARMMKEEFGATDPAAMSLRFMATGSGSYFERQQPLVNIVRGTMTSLIGVLGGCTALQTPSYDEAWCTPTEETVRLALRTQQVLRYESGVARVADPLAGSYYLECLTDNLEEEILSVADKIEQMGGWIAALEKGWIQTELTKGAVERQKKVETGERVCVGVNRFTIPPEEDFQPRIYTPEPEIGPYIAQYEEFKKNRDYTTVKETLENLRRAAEKADVSLVPYAFEAIEAHATFGKIIGVLRIVDGLEYDLTGEREYPF